MAKYKWRTVVIGEGPEPSDSFYMGTPELSNGYKSIGENKYSYWIHNVFHNYGMTVYKDSHVGDVISYLIELGESEEGIKEYLQEIFIENVKPNKLIEIVDEAVDEAYARGIIAKTEEYEY